MANLDLLASTGREDVDAIIARVIHTYRLAFPEKFCAAYLIGSFADQTSVSVSDIDTYILFRDEPTEDQSAQAAGIAEDLSADSPVRLDIVLRTIAHAAADHSIPRTALTRNSLHIYGEDVRPQIPVPTLKEYRHDVSEVWRISAQWVRGQDRISLPLTYPEADDEFYGYTRKRIDAWYPSHVTEGTKELVALATRFASAILAIKYEQRVGSKAESVKQYKVLAGDVWAEYVGRVYSLCNLRYHYQIPPDSQDRAELRALCRQTIDFENHYFDLYRSYLLNLRDTGDADEQIYAQMRLESIGLV